MFSSKISQEDADQKAREYEAASKATPPKTKPSSVSYPEGSVFEFVENVWMPRTYARIRQGSKRRYDSQLQHHIMPVLGIKKIKDVGYDDVCAFMAHERGKGTSPQLIRECVMRIREILGLHAALMSGRGVHVRFDWKLADPPKKPRKKKRVVPPEGITHQLLSACTGGYEWLKGPIVASAYLGLRRGEICGLMKSKIDAQRGKILVSEQITPDEGPNLVPVKGGEDRERIIYVPTELIEILMRFSDPDSVYLFTAPIPGRGRIRADREIGRGVIPPNKLTKEFSKLARSLGHAITFHDLRAYAATNLKELGVNPYVVAEILGHANIETTGIYTDAREASTRDAIKKLAELLGSVDKNEGETG